MDAVFLKGLFDMERYDSKLIKISNIIFKVS